MNDSTRSLEPRVLEFRARIDNAKKKITNVPWYRYDSFQTVQSWRSFTVEHDIAALLKTNPVVDIGCGDGSLAFFLEWAFGCEVHAIDNPRTNFNGMRGIRALKEALGSKVTIIEADVDEALPERGRYSLALMLGVLYHLKNPIGVMSAVARHAQHCVMSTRIAQRMPEGGMRFQDTPLVYLAEQGETNRDDTNYWFFSETALARLLRRTGWEIVDSYHSGCLAGSDPVHKDRDERMHCLLRSCLPEAWYTVYRTDGFYADEGNWCWTGKSFRFEVRDFVEGPRGVQFEFFVSPKTITRFGSVRLRLQLNGAPMPQREYRNAGLQQYQAEMIAAGEDGYILRLDFELDNALEEECDARMLGVIVSGLDSDCGVRLMS